MMRPNSVPALEEQIDQWRSSLRKRQAIHAVDIAYSTYDIVNSTRVLLADDGLDMHLEYRNAVI